jgi:hypothetical protein
MVLVVVIMGVLCIMSLAVASQMVSNSKFSNERENLIRVFYVNQSGKEHAMCYLKTHPGTIFYTSGLIGVQSPSGVPHGQLTYQILDVTPEESDPVKKITIMGYYPLQEEALAQKEHTVYAVKSSEVWSIRTEFQTGR